MSDRTVEHDFASWRQRYDSAALSRVFDTIAPELLLVARHIAGRGTAEDLLQATFLEAIQHAARWDEQRPLRPWLIGILVRLALRQRQRDRRPLDPERLARPPAPDPHEVAATEEAAQALADALRALPLTYRQTLTLRLVHDLEPTAIAHALGAPVATVKSRLQRGMELLRRSLPAGLRVPALAAVTPRSLAAVKATVLEHATTLGGVSAASATAATTTGIGVMVLMNKTMLTAVGALALTGTLALAWFANRSSPERGGNGPPAAPGVAMAAGSGIETDAPTGNAPPTPAPARSSLTEAAAPAVATPRIEGRVVDEAGAGLAGISVFLALPGRSDEFSDESMFLVVRGMNPGPPRAPDGVSVTQTATDGHFAFAKPDDAMRRVLLAWSAERGCKMVELGEQAASPIVIELRQGRPLVGTVRSRRDREPIANAEVHVWPEGSGMPIAFVRTDAQGRFASPPLPIQGYRGHAAADGFANGDFHNAAGVLSADLELEPLPVLSATLVSTDGAPWTAARIAAATGGEDDDTVRFALTRASYERLSELEADTATIARLTRLTFDGASGRLEGPIIDADAHVLSVWRGAQKLAEAELANDALARVVIAFAAPEVVNVDINVVFDPPPQPPVIAKVTIADTESAGTQLVPLQTAETRGGIVSLPVPASFVGRACAVQVEAEGYVEHFAMVVVPGRGRGAWHEATLRRGAVTLRGRAFDPGGKPPTRATIVVVNADGSPLRASAKSIAYAHDDGMFSFEGLPRIPVRLLVAASECAPRAVEVDLAATDAVDIELRSGRPLRVRFPQGVKVRFRMLDAADRPIQDDRLCGSTSYGNGFSLRIDPTAVTLEAYDAVTGELMDRGPIPAQGDIRLDDRK